jgi:hypothetical protein
MTTEVSKEQSTNIILQEELTKWSKKIPPSMFGKRTSSLIGFTSTSQQGGSSPCDEAPSSPNQ